jgi:hypothetical protein
MRSAWWGVCCCLILTSCSKGPDYGLLAPCPTTGQVLVKGQPVPGMQVTFLHTANWGIEKDFLQPRGVTDKDGRFVLTTYTQDDGAPAGEYKVTLVLPVAEVRGMQSGNRLPSIYEKAATTPLKTEVVKGKNELAPFDLNVTLEEADPTKFIKDKFKK